MTNQRPRPTHRIFTSGEPMTDQPRHRRSHEAARPEATAEGADRPAELPDPRELERLVAELETARQEAAEHLATLQRTAAEFQNYRRRTTEERERDMGLASEYLLGKVLVIADDFDRAIEAVPDELRANAWTEGITAIDRKLRALLESEGVRGIEALGLPFDPREHEAVTNLPGTGRPDGEVVAEIRRGYRLRNKVLRPALVAVAAGGGAAGGQPPQPPNPDATERPN